MSKKRLYVIVDGDVQQAAAHLAHHCGYGSLTAVVTAAIRRLYESEMEQDHTEKRTRCPSVLSETSN